MKLQAANKTADQYNIKLNLGKSHSTWMITNRLSKSNFPILLMILSNQTKLSRKPFKQIKTTVFCYILVFYPFNIVSVATLSWLNWRVLNSFLQTRRNVRRAKARKCDCHKTRKQINGFCTQSSRWCRASRKGNNVKENSS